MDEFRHRRRNALREAWRDWAILGLLLGGALVTVVFVAAASAVVLGLLPALVQSAAMR